MAASSEEEMCARVPIIVVLGATGSGKSKLGIEIARKFGGEVLSADSMQVYKGLDIVTNKVTAEERRQAPHHMLDVVEPPKRFTVLDFRNRALPIIEDLMKNRKLPVIVGGTNYYIESLLWKVLVEHTKADTSWDHQERSSRIQEAINSAESAVLSEDLKCSDEVLLSDKNVKSRDTVDERGTKCQKKALNGDEGESEMSAKCNQVQDQASAVQSVEIPSGVLVCGDRKCQKQSDASNSSAETSVVSRGPDCSASDEICAKSEVDCECHKGDSKVMSAESESVHRESQNVSVGELELVYDRDRKRLREQPVDLDPLNKKPRLQDADLDYMDESALEDVPSLELHKRLQEVDPDMAQQLHPNNKRKIIRSLQVFRQTGRTHSAILREQRSAAGGSELGGPLRYPHSCILWLQCDQEVLDKRLDGRVDAMLEQGLMQELLDFHRRYNEERLAANAEPDYTKGIFQSIGFKEFHEYLILSEEERSSEKGAKLFEVGVAALKLVTKRYARRQLRWITNRFLRRPSRQVPPVYGLNATDPSVWDERVLGPAVQIVESFLKGEKPAAIEPLPVTERPEKNEMKLHNCEVCGRMFVGDIQWNDHLHSKKHHRMLKRKQVHTD
ncbi:tRNA dimethylallyltransferase [Periplaneta americana]|uniref:tRNA dimethylallyltransferase n=1 Tax=Periplaneta americana TaxID=6978 RepID=UPI0037E7DA75